jgi:hypothetical protein
MNNTLINETKKINTTQKQSDQDLISVGNINDDESLLIEQRARTTLKQFKEMMSKFKTLNVNAPTPPAKSASKSELKANVSHIKCPDDVVRLVNHSLYSPIGIHRAHPVQEKKIRKQHSMDVNNDDSPLKKHTTKEFENKFSFGSLTHSQKSVDNSNGKGLISQAPHRLTPMVDLSNNGNQRNLNELSTENLDERNELRKRKRTVAVKSLSPHPSSINNSSKTINY